VSPLSIKLGAAEVRDLLQLGILERNRVDAALMERAHAPEQPLTRSAAINPTAIPRLLSPPLTPFPLSILFSPRRGFARRQREKIEEKNRHDGRG
jgi:hypothetical protein